MGRLGVRRGVVVSCGCVLAALGGCADARFGWMRDLGRDIDPVAQGLEEYGSVSMSSPLLASPSTGHFAFEPNVSAETFYKDARQDVAGAAALSYQQSLDERFGVSLRGDINALLQNVMSLQGFSDDMSKYRRAQSLRELQTSVAGLRSLAGLNTASLTKSRDELTAALAALRQQQATGTTPAAPTPAEQNLLSRIAEVNAQLTRNGQLDGQLDVLSQFTDGQLGLPGTPKDRPSPPTLVQGSPPALDPNVLPEKHTAQEVLSDSKFTKPFELLKETPKLPDRAALMVAAGDTVTRSLLQFLANPADAEKFKDKAVLIGVSMVSVAPGNRTYRGYAAEVSLSVSYEERPVRARLLEQMKQSAGEGEPLSEVVARAYKPAQNWPNTAEQTMAEQIALASREFERQYPKVSRARVNSLREILSQEDGARMTARHIQEVAVQQAGFEFSEIDALQAFLQTLPRKVEPDTAQSRRAEWRATTQQRGDFERLAQRDSGARALADDASRADVSPLAIAEFSTLALSSLETSQFRSAVQADLRLRYPRAPLVAAVSPFTDSQTLDLRSSFRDQEARALQIAVALSGMGLEGQAKYFRDFVKRLEQDVATRGEENFVSAFSTSGGVFGYQIGPRLKALDNPASRKAEPDYILERMSFPVLILIGIDRDDLNLRIRKQLRTREDDARGKRARLQLPGRPLLL